MGGFELGADDYLTKPLARAGGRLQALGAQPAGANSVTRDPRSAAWIPSTGGLPDGRFIAEPKRFAVLQVLMEAGGQGPQRRDALEGCARADTRRSPYATSASPRSSRRFLARRLQVQRMSGQKHRPFDAPLAQRRQRRSQDARTFRAQAPRASSRLTLTCAGLVTWSSRPGLLLHACHAQHRDPVGRSGDTAAVCRPGLQVDTIACSTCSAASCARPSRWRCSWCSRGRWMAGPDAAAILDAAAKRAASGDLSRRHQLSGA